MKSLLSSADSARAVGYQPVGMKPRALESPFSAMSITATLLLSALATYNRVPSCEITSASGVEPVSAFGSSDVRMVSVTLPDSMTLTLLDPELATNRRPFRSHNRSLGWLAVWMRTRSASVAGSRRLTDSPPQLETASVRPSSDSSAAYGRAPVPAESCFE